MVNTGDCWHFAGHINSNGYGLIFSGGKRLYAHRVMYGKPIPKNKQTDHLCMVRCCINPLHLEIVSRKTNILRGNGTGAMNARKTHCKNGHKFTKSNTYIDKLGKRVCRACHRDWARSHIPSV